MTTQYDLIVIGTELDISSIEELSNLGAPGCDAAMAGLF